jgi:hypothetical protein
MLVYRGLFWCAVALAIVLVPVRSCAARDWAAYVLDGSFEAGDHLDAVGRSSEGTLLIEGIDQSSFIATASKVTFIADGTSLSTDPASVRVFRNGLSLPASHVELTSQSIALSGALLPGLNHVVLLAKDVDDHALSAEVDLWAGNNPLLVEVLDENDNQVSGAQVRLELADSPDIFKTAITVNGAASFANIPPTTISLTVQGDGNMFGRLSSAGDVGSAIIRAHGFRPASVVDNNDFSLGLQGWEVGSAPASLIAHDESGDGSPKRRSTVRVARNAEGQARGERSRHDKPEDSLLTALAQKMAASKGSDMDLILTTSGIGGQSLSRTFEVAPDTARIKVRYRFITSEAVAGYFGSQYNDDYSIAIRTLNGGLTHIVSNSMNRLGIDAFDENGSTAWYSATLPIHGNGLGKSKAGSETVQVDVAVTNIGDGDFDSAVVIDYIEQEPLSISSDLSIACPNQAVTFEVEGSPPGTITWTGGGQPAAGNGAQFVTRFAQPGQMTVRAEQNDNGNVRSADATVSIWETSGSAWAAQFATSTQTTDLVQPFRDDVDDFIDALRAGNATVNIAATLRPPERAHLMHYSYRISQDGLDPETVPEYQGVNICWTHRDANGTVDVPASTAAARAMVNAYGIQFPPALQSRHTQGRAIDMSVTWTGDLDIQAAGGATQTITTTPRTGAGNVALHGVGAGYGVLKLVADPPHWSDDGH